MLSRSNNIVSYIPLYFVYMGTKSKYIKYNYILSIYGLDDSIGL